ncbi:MAG: hypothetical protein M3O71_21085 [Bacteroidota bacterium]|nr:hypothetical protein [Bacteroidota bacterium]
MENAAAIREPGRTPRPSAGRKRSTAQPFKKRTRAVDHNGFLRHTFQPVWLYEGEQAIMEREYFHSLSNLCSYYGIAQPCTEQIAFPQNIYQSWLKVAGQLEQRDKDLTCMIVTENKKQAVLAVAKTFGMGNDLYYIPVRAFWRWVNSPQHQAISELITAIFAYLHQIALIPFYQENGSFMDNQYETLYQWLMEAGEDDDEEGKGNRQNQEDTLYELRQAGAHIMPIIQDPVWMTKFENVILNYIPPDDAGQEFSDLANEFLKLYKDHPMATVFDNTYPELLYADEEERITPEQYTGFYWSAKDCFTDELDDMINCSFQEIPVMDEPVIIQLFDTIPENNAYTFDFETRLFALMESLRDLLNEYDHDEHNDNV